MILHGNASLNLKQRDSFLENVVVSLQRVQTTLWITVGLAVLAPW